MTREQQLLGDVTIKGLSAAQLAAMADGLAARGDFAMAKGLYGIALKRATPAEARSMRVRLGLVSAAGPRTQLNLTLLDEITQKNLANPFVSDGMATWMKTLPFEDDARFQEISERHAHLLPLPNWHWNLQTALWAVREAKDVPGDFVELGVFKGHTTLFCAEYVGFQDWPRQWWLYDTFEGIPEDQQNPGWKQINVKLYKDTFSWEEVRDRFAHIPNIQVIKGRVPEILQEGAPEKVAFMHVDMNNAPAEIAALDFFFDRISPGGVILFDDFCWASARTQYDAEVAWFSKRGLQVLPLPTGQGLFIKR